MVHNISRRINFPVCTSPIITVKGDRLTIVVNGREVIARARLKGIPASGPVALQRHGDPIEFNAIYVKKLE